MRRRCTYFLRLIPVAAALAAAVSMPALAQEGERFYTGVALTYSFGDANNHLGSADLSLGAIEHEVDARQSVSVMHLPLVQVPLIRQGEPVLAPLAAALDAMHWLNRSSFAAATAATACAKHCELNLSLPDLGGR